MRRLINRFSHLYQRPAQVQAVSFSVRLRWALGRWLPSFGWPGVLSVALLIMLIPFYFSAIQQARERLSAAQRDSISTREKIQLSSRAVSAQEGTAEEQLVEYYRIFPGELDSPEWLGKMAVIAEKTGLKLNEGEYKTTRDKVGRLMHFQITLPVSGQYPQIREFVAEVPVQIPVIALESVEFERKTVSDPAVEAKIVFRLYLEQAQ
ncbi:MAG: hypothetical protein WC736_12290 [Gallionella sp.]|jgi:Tfp pilus assembly protein PilO